MTDHINYAFHIFAVDPDNIFRTCKGHKKHAGSSNIDGLKTTPGIPSLQTVTKKIVNGILMILINNPT